MSQVSIVINGKNLTKKAFSEVQADIKTTDGLVGKLGTGLVGLTKIGVIGFLSTVAVGIAGIGTAVKKASNFELINKQFDILLRDGNKATSMIQDLRKMAASTPLAFNDVATGAANLLAYGIASESVVDDLRMIGDVAKGSSAQLSAIVSAYGKIKASGKASMEQINRFTENGVPLLSALADVYDVTTNKVMKMASAGKISFEDIHSALTKLTSDGGQFEGMMSQMASTLSGKWSTFKDNVIDNIIGLGDKILPSLKTAIDSLSRSFDAVVTSDGFEKFVSTTVRWVTWSLDQFPKVAYTIQLIGDILAITAKHMGQFFADLRNSDFPPVKAVFELGGKVYDALKKGIKEGDWSDVFDVSLDVLKTGLAIFATFRLAQGAANILFATAQTALKKAGFSGMSEGVASAGIIAVASILITLKQASDEGKLKEWSANIVWGLIAGFATAGLTGSVSAGALVFSVVLDFKLASKLGNLIDNARQKVRDFLDEANEKNPSAMTRFADTFLTTVGVAAPKQTVTVSDQDKSQAVDILSKYESAQQKARAIISGTEIGSQIAAGMKIGMEDLDKISHDQAVRVIKAYREALGIHSPSKEFKNIGLNSAIGFSNGFSPIVDITRGIATSLIDTTSKVISLGGEQLGTDAAEGFVAGITDQTWITEIKAAVDKWRALMWPSNTPANPQDTINGILGADKPSTTPTTPAKNGFLDNIWSQPGGLKEQFLGKEDSNGTITGGMELAKMFTDLSGVLSGGILQFVSMFSSVSSVNALLNPLTTIMTAMMAVLEPVLNQVLAPLVGILTTIGTLIGKILAPAIQILTPIIQLVTDGFVWLYNNVLIYVGNGIISIFNVLYNIVAGIHNAVSWLWGGKMEYKSLDSGYLQEISSDSVNQSGSNYIGGSGSTGSSTSVNSYTIEVYQTIEGNVIGDGGMASLGEFLVQALRAYMGSGGRIEIVEAAV